MLCSNDQQMRIHTAFDGIMPNVDKYTISEKNAKYAKTYDTYVTSPSIVIVVTKS